MDRTHGDSTGGWDAGGFAEDAWNHQFGGPGGLTFDQSAVADSGYSSANYAGNSGMNPELPSADAPDGLYPPFSYYGQGDVWPGQEQAAAATFGQDASLQQGYLPEPRHPSSANQDLEGQFHPAVQHGINGFTAQHHSVANQHVTPQHGFTHDAVLNPGVKTLIPHWQEQVPGPYGPGHQYEELLAAQAADVGAQVSNDSSATFFAGHGAGATSMPSYQNEQVQQPAGEPPVRIPTSQHMPQQVALRAPHYVQHYQPVQQQAVLQPGQQQGQQHTLQAVPDASASRQLGAQQPINQAQQVPHSEQPTAESPTPNPEAQPTPNVAKKAKLLAPATAGSPSSAQTPAHQPSSSAQTHAYQPNLSGQTQAHQPSSSAPICSINYQDPALLSTASGDSVACWAGVPNLLIGSAPVRLQKGTPTKRYVTLSTRGGRNPLFSKLWRAWTPAESLGNHAEAYQKAATEVDYQRADIRLELEFRRGNSEIPIDWWKKGLKDRLGKEPDRPEPPPEPLRSVLKAVECLRLHPAHIHNEEVVKRSWEDFARLFGANIDDVKGALKATLEKPSNGEAVAEADIRLIKEQLARTIVEAQRLRPSILLTKLREFDRLVVRLNNILILLINVGEANSPLAKAILRLYSRLPDVTPQQIKDWRMDKIRDKLEKSGDAQAKGLMARLYENAKQNDGVKGEDGPPGAGPGAEPSTEPSDRGKQTAAAQARAVSKRAAPGTDHKKAATPFASPAAEATADSKKKSTASTTLKTMAPSTEASKATAKASQKPAAAATGAKRSREDDAAAAEARSSKKAATESPSATATSSGSKASSTSAKSMAKPSTGTTPSGPTAAAQPKARSGLLLPGKARPAPKAVTKTEAAKVAAFGAKAATPKAATKPESAKAAAPKAVAKPESAPKLQPAATAAAKNSKSSSDRPGWFSNLMVEVTEDKKITTPETAAKKASPPAPAETPEERERRIRKEKRRHLRVAFKSGDELVEVREFTRHPDEIAEGHMARNVRTDGRYKNSEESEMMKKLHGGKGIKAVEVNDREWEEPTAINFAAHISSEKRDQAYVTRGGLKTFETEEQKLMRERESKELMVIYHNPSDIPPTARSPPYEPSLSGHNGVREGHLSPAAPRYDELVQRGREFRQWGPFHASRAAQGRLDGKALRSANSTADSYNGQAARPSDARPPQTRAQDPHAWYEPDVAARRDQQTYELLSSDRLKNWQDPDPYHRELAKKAKPNPEDDPKLQKVLAGLEAVVASVRAQAAAQAEAQATSTTATQATSVTATQPSQPTQATSGTATQATQPLHQPPLRPATATAPVAPAAAPDYSAAWAQYYAAQQQQQQQQQHHAWYGQYQNPYTQPVNPYVQPQAAQAAQPQQTVDPNSQVASILAALRSQQQAAQSQVPYSSAADPNSQYQAAATTLASGGQAQATGPAAANLHSGQQLLDWVQRVAAQNQQGQQQPGGQGAYQPAQHAYGYGHSHQEREAYGQMYGVSPQNRERDAYGGGRDRDRERDRDRDRDHRDHRDHRDYHRGSKGGRNGGGGGGGGKNDNIPDHLRGINRNLIGTKACAFWAKGQCAKGDKCTFRHD